MTSLLRILRMVLMLLPFGILCWMNYKANIKKPQRYKQFLMPLAALILCVVAIILLTKIYDLTIQLFYHADDWFDQLGNWITTKLPALSILAKLMHRLASAFRNLMASLNLEFWAFYVANALILLGYILLKKPILLLMKGLFRDGGLFQKLAGLFYEYDEASGVWSLQPKFGQARTFLKTLYITAVVLGAVGVLVSSKLYKTGLLHAVYYPVFSVIILGELYFALDGLTLKELRQNRPEGEDDEAARITNYSAMRDVLRKLFPDKLNAENTTVSTVHPGATTNDELLTELESSDYVAVEAYGRYMRSKLQAGMELDFNYLTSGKLLLNGESVLFNNPFYYDLIPYIFFPMNRALLQHKKVLIVLGRHGTEESIQAWCQEGLCAVTNIPTMWNIGVLGQEPQDLNVGIVTRSSVHDLQMHEANQEFFDDVDFVVLIEPSRLVTTAQVGLNSLVRHCRRKQKHITYCSMDKNCDGLLDALSHILMVSLREVSATNHHTGASSYMIWEADSDHLQHRMLPNLSRYLGMGTELSFAALKNQIPHTGWYGGDAFPVVDINWIAQQYYYDLLNYANLPASQEMMDRVFRVYPDMWSAPATATQYLTVEDEAFNMFEVKRDFSTRAKEQGFINVICSEYLLKDYMAGNDSIFNADPKAIPYITADYARTPRNVVLRLCLRMSTGLVSEEDIRRDLIMIDRDATYPVESLWNEICVNCGYVGSTDAALDGRKVLRCHTAGADEVFGSDVLVRKRRFNMNSGRMENMYTITNGRFIRLLLSSLRPAEYVAEDERGEHQYLGTELQGHIYQKYLPGQFFTFSGKYYEMLRVTSDGQVLVRRASEHISGRPSYRQVRNYTICNPVDSQVMGECRDMGSIRITRQYADIRVETPAYWKMNRYNDFSSAVRIGINGVPTRVYNNKALLRIDLQPQEELPEGTVPTLVLLINEVLRSLLAENQDYLVAVSAGDAQIPTTYSLQGQDDFQPQANSIYLIEDSQLDIGLLDAVERNLNRILCIICDYLQWHEEALVEKPEEPDQEPEPEEEPAAEGEPEGKKPGLIKRILIAIGNFFKKIGAFFKKIFSAIANFFRKLFKRKPKEPQEAEPPVTEQPAEPAVPAEAENGNGADVSEPQEQEADTEESTPAETAPAVEEPVEEPVEATPVEGDLAAQAPQEEQMMSLFSTAADSALEAEAAPTDEELVDAPVETAPGSDDDTVDFEPEEVIEPEGTTVLVPIQRLPYKERYYLRYGSDAIAQTLQLTAVKELLIALGYDNNSLTQARRGLDAAKMVERTFVPNREGVHYCDFCGCEITGMDYDILADGRERCPACGRTAVKTLEEFVQLHDAVLRNMKMFFGIRINAPVHVQMVNSKKLHRRLKQTFIPTDKSDGRILGVAIKDGSGYSILIENGAPRLQSTMTMVHEMTHIWQYLNWDGKQIKKTYGSEELEVYEGMSKWVEIQYAYLLGEAATAKREEIITSYRDDPYGRGFVKYRKKYPLSEGTRLKGSTPFDNPRKPL